MIKKVLICLSVIVLSLLLVFAMKPNEETPRNETSIQLAGDRIITNIYKNDCFIGSQFTLFYEIREGDSLIEQWEARFILIEDGKYRVEDRLKMAAYITSYLDGDEDLAVWEDTIYSDDEPYEYKGDADTHPAYCELLDYYKKHKSTIPKK